MKAMAIATAAQWIMFHRFVPLLTVAGGTHHEELLSTHALVYNGKRCQVTGKLTEDKRKEVISAGQNHSVYSGIEYFSVGNLQRPATGF